MNETTPTEQHSKNFSRSRATIVTTLFLCGLVVTLVMYSLMASGASTGVDRAVLTWMVAHRTPELTVIMEFITNLLSPVIFALTVIAGSGLWAWQRREVWRPMLLVTAMAITFIVAATIKELVARARPPVEMMVPPFELDMSFPSGHTIGIAALSLIVGYLIYSRQRRVDVLVTWIVVAIASTVLVAISRMYLGYHWLTDVSASVGLAVMVLAGVILLDGLRYRYRLTRAVSSSDQ